jgi:hypothetical protein
MIRRGKNNLFVLLLMAILSQSFLTLVRRNLMTLTLFTTRHTQFNFGLLNIFFVRAGLRRFI